ncbi:PREDICTED: hydrocephalus-inducing protein-like [Vollenhovia emeryi]|uniref:hydrocephalus-inducing protein-like n=1 Tax=Vollenhovia emeryi TaxID=411798 RepID=UPI0005F5193B|nr:PREDICTED: hydrocephalus-inducing protein-like [Vollenhovia emeryi]
MSRELENISNAMNDYYNRLLAIENIIKNWDSLKKDPLLTLKSKIVKTDRLIDTKDKTSDISKEIYTNGFHIWYVNATDPWNRVMYDVIVNQIKESSLAKKALQAFQIVSLSTLSNPIVTETNSSHTSVISKPKSSVKNTNRRERVFNKNKESLAVSLNASTIESVDTNASSVNTIYEKVLKPRWTMLPNEIQKFKIRYQPEDIGTHRQTYALSILDGNDITYDINVYGATDIPMLDMNPNAIFSKVITFSIYDTEMYTEIIEETKVNDIIEPTYFSDVGIYDFGSLLIFRKDKSAHRREVTFKFCNVSKVDAQVSFSLQENNSDIFIIEPEKLYIQISCFQLFRAGQCKLLKISASVTKLGLFTDKLYVCITNNPHVEIIELRCNGTKLDIEFEGKQLHFGQVLLYRKSFLSSFIRNRSPIEIFWHLAPDEPFDPQISITPIKGIVRGQSDQRIEFCCHANKVKDRTALNIPILITKDINI